MARGEGTRPGRYRRYSIISGKERCFCRSLPDLLKGDDIADGRRHSAGAAGLGLVGRGVDQLDAERPLDLFPDSVFRNEIALLDLLDQDLTLFRRMRKIQRRPFLLFPGSANPFAVVVDDIALDQVKDIPRPPPGCGVEAAGAPGFRTGTPPRRDCWTSLPYFAHLMHTQSSAPSTWTVLDGPWIGAPHNSHCMVLAKNFISILPYIINRGDLWEILLGKHLTRIPVKIFTSTCLNG